MLMKQRSLGFCLFVCLALGAGASPNWKQTLEQLRKPQSRAKAMETLGEVVYELKDARLRGQICETLIEQLRISKSAAERRELASLLESYLSHEKTPSIYFEKTEPWLLDQDKQVRHRLWLAFYQQASQTHLKPAQEERLHKLIDHENEDIRWEALNWANEAVQNRQRALGEPISALGAKVLPIQLKLSRSQHKALRNLAIYGCFQQFDFSPDKVAEVAAEHLGDPDGGTRSLVLDFLQKYARRSAVLCQLQPKVLERFRSKPVGSDFPAVPDAELGPDASPPLGERYRLAETAASMGPLPDDVWTYLEGEAVSQVPPAQLAQLAQSQGAAGRRLLALMLTPQNLTQAYDALADCGATNELVPAVLKELKDPENKEDQDGAVSAGLLLSLVERPEVLPVAELYLKDTRPPVRAAAAYVIARASSQGPLAAQAALALQQTNWKEAYYGTTLMLAAVQRLRKDQRFALDKLQVARVDVNLLLCWMLGQEKTDEPQFVDDYERGAVFGDRLEPGVRLDGLQLEMDWIAAHKERRCVPGLQRLLYHFDPAIQAKARATLATL